MVVYHYGRKQWQYYHIEISSRKFFSKLSANVVNENLKRNTSTNKLVFNAVFTRFLNFGKRIRSLAIFDSDDKIFFPVFFFSRRVCFLLQGCEYGDSLFAQN